MLEAAIAFADANGIESLSMRKLSAELGYEVMSLYNHVANKDDILDGIVDLVVSEIEQPAGAEDWETAMRTCAISAHEALLRHPWACSLILAPTLRVIPARLRYIDWLLGRLRQADFSAETTYHGYHALDSHILGFTLWELGHSIGPAQPADVVATVLGDFPADEYPYLAEHIEQHLADGGPHEQGEFEFGLELILDGLKRIRAGA